MEPIKTVKTYPSFEDWIVKQKGFEKGPDARYFGTFDYETKDISNDEKTLVATISTITKDRAGDILDPKGISLDAYSKNPVVLWAHDYRSKPIAKSLWIKATGSTIKSKAKFAAYPEAQEIFNLYRDGFLNAWSVGFIPEKFEPRFMKDAEGNNGDFEGYDITSWELLEYSAVPVPANPDALTNAYQGGKLKLSPVMAKSLGLEKIDPQVQAAIIEAEEVIEDIGTKEVITKPEPDVTENYIRIRVKDPDLFVDDSFRTIDISKEEGIKAVIGKLKSDPDGPTQVQTYLFEKDKWSVEEAQKWVDEHEKAVADFIAYFETLEKSEHNARILMIANEAICEELKSLQVELKEGRVLSTKNRDLIGHCVTEMGQAISALNDLLAATEPVKDEPKAAPKTIRVELTQKPRIEFDVNAVAEKMCNALLENASAELTKIIRKKQGKID